MDIKHYIDYFDEISHLEREQQFTLLEQAFSEVNAKFGLPVLSLMPYFFRIVFVLLITGGCYYLLSQSIVALLASVVISLLCSRLVVTEITDSVISKTLKHLLANNTQ